MSLEVALLTIFPLPFSHNSLNSILQKVGGHGFDDSSVTVRDGIESAEAAPVGLREMLLF